MTAGDDDAGGDAILAAIAALRQVASSGSVALGGILGRPEAAQALGGLLGLLGRAGPGAERAGSAADAIGFIGQAYLLAATSGFRYWARVAETTGAHHLDVLRSLGGAPPTEREMIDGLRAYARQLGDVSLQEARLFQVELDRLAAGLAPAEATDAEYRRRWRTKS